MTNENGLLIPFKAKFEYHFNSSISELFDKDNLQLFLERSSENSTNVKTADFLKNYLTGSDLSIFKRDRKIDFDFHTRHSISPEFFSISSINQNIKFIIDSDTVEVLQIESDSVTFSNSVKEIKTEKLTDRIKLFKL